jgi:hypothetical protein
MDVITSNKERTAATQRRQGEGGWRTPPRSVAATGIRRTTPGESSTAQVWPSGERWCTISCNGNRRPYNAWVGSITSTMAVETTVLPLWGVCCGRFEVLRIDQDDSAPVLSQVAHWSPRPPGTFAGDHPHAEGVQPIAQREEIPRHGRKGAHLAVHPAIRLGDQDTGHHRVLMDVQSSTTLLNHLQLLLPSAGLGAGAGCGTRNTVPPRAHLPSGEGRPSSTPGRTRVSFTFGLTAPKCHRPWNPCPAERLPHFHPLRCRAPTSRFT